MSSKISVVINTLNAEKLIERALKDVEWADEILVCDMYSSDKTVELAKKKGAKIIYHKKLEYVEPARNFAISKASGDWVLILDPDEEVPQSLGEKLIQLANNLEEIDYVRIPRKNIIFNKWMKASQWWPDYNIRFFKKGKIEWGDEIHRPPKTLGVGLDLPEEFFIIHHNYQTVSQFIIRMDRYTTVEADHLLKQKINFNWTDLVEKPLGEFLSRFFANKGYEDGLHGLALSLMQAFSFLIVYLKVWQGLKFKEVTPTLTEIESEKNRAGYQIHYWMKDAKSSKNLFKKIISRFKT